MSVSYKYIKLGSADCSDTNVVYLRLMEVYFKDVSSHQLAPVPTVVFKDHGNMRITKSKSRMKWNLQVEQSSRTMPINSRDKCCRRLCSNVDYLVAKHCTVQDYVNNVLEYIFGKLQHSLVNVIFARYYESYKDKELE